jgi:predicted nucleic acid-binding protein
MITVDSSVWTDYFNGTQSAQTQALDAVLDDSSYDLVILDLVLVEVLRGYRQPHEWAQANRVLSALPVLNAGGEVVARAASAMYRQLRAVGVTVRSSIDLLVGAWCIEHGCALIHNDRDFLPMQQHHGLPVFAHD